MLIRSKTENSLVDFNGNGVCWSNGYVGCMCGGGFVKIKNSRDFVESQKIIDAIQAAYLAGEKIIEIE